MNNPQKLELTWIGKDQQTRLEPRILIEDPSKSYGDKNTENMLIFGDNLLALKALEQDYAGKIKCIYIDPPYNTGNAFEHYDDGIEHSLWLNLMKPRLHILHNLLSEEGSIWITLDDTEVHYCKVLCDEIFGRGNFLADVIWEKSDSPRMDAVFFSSRHDHILVYVKNTSSAKWNHLEVSDSEIPAHYDKVDKKGRKYYLKSLRAMGGQGDSRVTRPTLYYPLIAPDGTEIFPIRQDGTDGAWRWNKEKVDQDIERIEWVKGRNGWAPYYQIFADTITTRPPETIWQHNDVGSNRTSKAEIKKLFPDLTPFGTPKPEKLIQRVIHIASNPGDLVLDSFLGSGTTAAVAHKMGRKWIGIELGEHCHTHCIPRLQKVVDGADQGGISKSVNWEGGGGFKYYYLAPSLLNEDKHGNWVISKDYNPQMLAAAMAKHEGFKYSPDESCYWKQGYSTEMDFIFTITNFVSVELLDRIHEEMQPGESLLVCCKAFQEACDGRYDNITIKKIPNMLLGRCEFGKEDYSLNIVNVPMESESEPDMELGITTEMEDTDEVPEVEQMGLFDKEDE